MFRYLASPFYSYEDDLDDDTRVPLGSEAGQSSKDDLRGHKRQRRSIFFSGPNSDSDEDDDHVVLANGRSLRSQATDNIPIRLSVIPATPYPANPLCKGACQLTPSFPRRSSSPCLTLAQAFVAVHEEPNATFRSYMEDRCASMTADGVVYLGIYDGHGGIDASTFLQAHLLTTIQAHLKPNCDVHDALTAAYSATNAAFHATGSIQGSTATTVILQRGRLIAANVGDSPAFVVKRSGEVYSVIQEHKIEGEEAARLAAQNVPIYRSPTGPAYMGTKDGTRWLNMSRAFGDFVYPAILCEPHVCSLDVSDGRFLVMGSDGLTEKWSVAEAALFLTQLAAERLSLAEICKRMVQEALQRGSTDNISCMVVDLQAYFMQADGAEAPPREPSSALPNEDEEMEVKVEAEGDGGQQRMQQGPEGQAEEAERGSGCGASGASRVAELLQTSPHGAAATAMLSRSPARSPGCGSGGGHGHYGRHDRSPSGHACEKRRRGDLGFDDAAGELHSEAVAMVQDLLCEETADEETQKQQCQRDEQEAALALLQAASCARMVTGDGCDSRASSCSGHANQDSARAVEHQHSPQAEQRCGGWGGREAPAVRREEAGHTRAGGGDGAVVALDVGRRASGHGTEGERDPARASPPRPGQPALPEQTAVPLPPVLVVKVEPLVKTEPLVKIGSVGQLPADCFGDAEDTLPRPAMAAGPDADLITPADTPGWIVVA